MANDKNKSSEIFCSFCGKTQDEVDHLIAGNGVYICDDCIEVCYQLTNAGVKTRQKRCQI